MKLRKYHVTAEQIVRDLEVLTDGIFEAKTEKGETCLLLSFSNGQKVGIFVQMLENFPQPCE